MKHTLVIGAVVIILLTIALLLIKPKETTSIPLVVPNDSVQQTNEIQNQDSARIANPDTQETPTTPEGKLKTTTFTGTLQVVDTGCFADGECYVEVDGKHITTVMGWSQKTVGSVIGVEGFGDLEKYIGKKVEVYAQDNSDGTYTLYGSEGFYIKVL
jgi:uncharacterized protein YxeA